jgi:hypothetical protein
MAINILIQAHAVEDRVPAFKLVQFLNMIDMKHEGTFKWEDPRPLSIEIDWSGSEHVSSQFRKLKQEK